MRWRVSLGLENVYGGDGEVRFEPVEKVTLNRIRTKTMVRDSIGVAVKLGTEEELRERRIEPISTFRLDEHGTPLMRLGGAHGKLWGALKSSAKQLYELGDEDFKRAYKSLVDMVSVSPAWVPLDTDEDFRLEGIPQVLKGRSGGMIVKHFDVIPKASAKVLLSFPDPLERKVRKLLDQLQLGSHLNKRRATITVEGIEQTS